MRTALLRNRALCSIARAWHKRKKARNKPLFKGADSGFFVWFFFGGSEEKSLLISEILLFA